MLRPVGGVWETRLLRCKLVVVIGKPGFAGVAVKNGTCDEAKQAERYEGTERALAALTLAEQQNDTADENEDEKKRQKARGGILSLFKLNGHDMDRDRPPAIITFVPACAKPVTEWR
jgi:hypothetical protein